MKKVAIASFGAGNRGSVENMISYLDCEPVVVADGNHPGRYSHLILPGVGSFDHGRLGLAKSGLDDYVFRHLDAGGKVLGMCLGMQLLLDRSEEGSLSGLALIDGYCEKIKAQSKLKVPRIGWNWLAEERGPVLSPPYDQKQRFYFTHSYHAVGVPDANILARTNEGGGLIAAIGRENVVGVQFHPEKSHKYGMQLFERFLEWGN